MVTINLNTFNEGRGWETSTIESREVYTRKDAEYLFNLLWEELVIIEDKDDNTNDNDND